MSSRRGIRPRTTSGGSPRGRDRDAAVRRLIECTNGLVWSRALIAILLDELSTDDEFETLIGKPEALSEHQYPQAVAIAIALRYSWRRDEFGRIMRRIRALDLRKPPK
jgi:hypothetical protein